MRPEILFVGMEAHWDKSGGKILLDDDTGGAVYMLSQIGFQCTGVRISSGIPFYAHLVDCTNTRFWLAQNLTWA
jgi:hypothetical protein